MKIKWKLVEVAHQSLLDCASLGQGLRRAVDDSAAFSRHTANSTMACVLLCLPCPGASVHISNRKMPRSISCTLSRCDRTAPATQHVHFSLQHVGFGHFFRLSSLCWCLLYELRQPKNRLERSQPYLIDVDDLSRHPQILLVI